MAKKFKSNPRPGEQKTAREKNKAVVVQFHTKKLKGTTEKVEDDIEEALTYWTFLVNIGPVSTQTMSLSCSTGKQPATP